MNEVLNSGLLGLSFLRINIMKFYLYLTLIFFWTLLSVGSTAMAQEVELAYNFKKDQQFRLTVRTNQVIEQDLGGFTQTIQNLIESDIQFKVVEVHSDSAQLEVVYKNLYFSLDGPMGEGIVMSSQGDAKDPINKIMRSMVNNPFYVHISKLGKILSVEGMDEVLGKINESLNLLDDNIKESIQSSIDNQFGEESFKSSFMTGLIVYPDRPLQVGDTWTSQLIDYSTVPLDMNTTWQLKNLRKQTANIEGNSTLQSKEKVNNNNSDGDDIIMTGTNNIRAVINISTGWLQESTQTSDISGAMVLPPNEYFEEAVEIPMRIKTITRTVLK